jgi:hypothetical protein
VVPLGRDPLHGGWGRQSLHVGHHLGHSGSAARPGKTLGLGFRV